MKRQKVIELDRVETKGFNIDWANVLVDEEVPELEIIGSDDKTPPPEPTLSGDDSGVCVRSLKDCELDDQLKRQRTLLSAFSEKLPDKGHRIRTQIGNLEYEKQRRMFCRTKPVCLYPKLHLFSSCENCFRRFGNIRKECEEGNSLIVFKNESFLCRTQKLNTFDADKCLSKSSDVFRQASTGSKDVSRPTFAANSSENPKMDARPVKKLFNEEVEDLGRESWKSKAGGETTADKTNGWRSMPRELGLKAPPSQRSSCRKKPDDKVINLDEDEPESPVVEKALELPEGLPEDICYPSRDDPDFVQVSLNDFKCLSPGEYLTSPVINFYIRFLQHQVFSENQTASNCHFFNTFFYKKLIEAFSYKGNDKDAFFVKLRRWWKGFDLFRKSYIFIPIHEDLHWSLVIICIPDKEDESGLTILHLDSLGLHPRRSIFNNVKRFLREEWNYLNQDAPSLDLPISERIWRDLPDRINEAKVPQQKNDFDCGLFVLFFIKKFIEEAPQRLQLQDLGMIHKKWFKPDEASALRTKIWNKLIELFSESNQTD
ncbi:unnamed protein product [Thlaspi arvense]|uniref:Ubiquitin-like protease family profile domain-containing protein n=1 Tax=Thlaspi arvense TaxID=13288 RepID=A0AAU9RCZ2_THLAR|nr:unnamed protein product [Thlaspi arvense]